MTSVLLDDINLLGPPFPQAQSTQATEGIDL